MILRKFKDIYNTAESMTCSGCHNEFKPVSFKCHIDRCSTLLHMSDPEIGIKINKVGADGTLSLSVDYQGLSWATDSIELSDMQYVIKNLKRDFPNLSLFTKNGEYDQVVYTQRKDLP